MNEQPSPISATIRSHQRQVLWQIILPFAVTALLLIAAAVWIAFFGEAKSNSLWRDISIIWLLIPMLVLAVILMILLAFLIYGLARVQKATPRVTARAQELTMQGAGYVRKFADGAAKPFIWVGQAGTAIRAIFKHQRRS